MIQRHPISAQWRWFWKIRIPPPRAVKLKFEVSPAGWFALVRTAPPDNG